MADIKVFRFVLISAFVVIVFSRSIPKKNVKYLDLSKCRRESRTIDDTDGYAPFTVKFYRCNEIYPTSVQNASCMYTGCVDPKMKMMMPPEYRSIPIYGCRTFKGRNGDVKMAMVVGCRCIYNKDYKVEPPKC